ncbi:MAG: helix-turn-helix transcriptional regulator [Candidatus Omnitrophica bacterium]|nr:helix-turn-helix transcriptional regulator [Candidatus Omnitrophota bacterium]
MRVSGLRTVRLIKGLRQYDVGKAIGVHEKKVSDWELEKSEPDSYEVSKLIDVLECTSNELYGLKLVEN